MIKKRVNGRLDLSAITMPPLRERRGDIPSLVHYFVQKKSREIGIREIPSLAQGALEKLMSYPWPGNVRELKNAVERALILNRGEPIRFRSLQASISGSVAVESPSAPQLKQEDMLAIDEVISLHIRRVLEMTGGRIGGEKGAARLLQINPSTLRKRMRKLGIPFGRKAKSFDSSDRYG